jgi:hypothetical protein
MRSKSNSADYFRQWEADELGLAERAQLAEAREIHLFLAEQWRYLAERADKVENEVQERRNRAYADTTLMNL